MSIHTVSRTWSTASSPASRTRCSSPPDAYYRTTGGDAVDGAPAILDRLTGLKQATLDAANDDATRSVLAPRLDAHLDDASDGIDRHVERGQASRRARIGQARVGCGK